MEAQKKPEPTHKEADTDPSNEAKTNWNAVVYRLVKICSFVCYQCRQNTYQVAITLLTFLGVALAAIVACIYYRQLQVMQTQLIVTQRAYVNVQEIKVITFEVGKPPEAVVIYKNSGLTPARNASVTPSSTIREIKNGPAEPVISTYWNGCTTETPVIVRVNLGAVIPPGVTRTVNTLRQLFGYDFLNNGQETRGILTNIPLDDGTFQAIRMDRKRWFVIVYISYFDQFGHCHASAEPFVYDFATRSFGPALLNWQQADN